MLPVDLRGTGGHFAAKQGSMVAYQGDIDFAYEGSGGMGKFFKKAFTGEGMALMRSAAAGTASWPTMPTRWASSNSKANR